MMRNCRSAAAFCVALAASALRAQAPEPADQARIQPPPALESTGLGTQVTPVPEEEVMRPTEQGLRFTPALARAFALGWITQNLGDRVDLPPDQLARFSESIAERTMRLAREDPQVTRDALESLFEAVVSRGPREKMDPQVARKTAEQMRPVLSRWQGLLDGIARDSESILTPEQHAEVAKAIERRHRRIDQLNEMMERWSRGEHQESDRIDRLLDPGLSDEELDPHGGDSRHPAYRSARRRAAWQSQRVGPGEWLQFLTVVKSSFRLDARQAAKADAIYADYKNRASAIMTHTWRQALRENRTKSEMRWEVKDLPAGPWLFHLEQEYRGLVKPIDELKRQFQKDVLALVTDQQREVFVNELREKFAAHGLNVQDIDRAAILALLR